MAVRAKLQLQDITKTSWMAPGAAKLTFRAQYDASIPEDQRFQSATPNAEATFQIDNPAALEQFKMGECYYVDFTPAQPPTVLDLKLASDGLFKPEQVQELVERVAAHVRAGGVLQI